MEIYVEDRISALPDSIIHYIFSFLDTREFVQTSILSHRWRHLWASTPYLKFHHEFYPSVEFTFHQPSSSKFKTSLNGFTDFVDRVLILREAFGIHEFQLFCDEELDAGHLYTWLLGALRRHAQVICLDLCINQPLDLPQHLFSSRVSTLEIYNNLYEVPIRMPKSMCSASRIKSLKLVGVELPDGNLEGELVLNCLVLEELILIECDHSHLKLLTISAVSLEKLELHTQCWERLEPCAVQICSSKLISFELTACMYTNCFFTNLSSLDSAYINTCEDSRMGEEMYDDCLVKVLRGLSNVRSLRMSTAVLKTITDSPSMLELFPSLFHNLRRMELIDWASDTCIKQVATFLENLPYVEAFVWSRLQKMKLGCWRKGGDIQMNSTLKTIEIRHSVGSEDEVKLLQILLERSTVLERVIISISESLAQDTLELEEFHEKLLKFPRASPSVQISFPLVDYMEKDP